MDNKGRHVHAGFFMRSLALFIDLTVLLMLYCGCFSWAAGFLFQDKFMSNWGVLFLAALLFLILFFLSFPLFVLTYYCLLHGWQGQTLGKMCLGLKVVSRQREDLTVGQAFLRLCATTISIVSLGLGYVWMLVDHDRCTWHDRLAATQVIVVK
jgi:uncharacterized RDD family membrane protein YckC